MNSLTILIRVLTIELTALMSDIQAEVGAAMPKSHSASLLGLNPAGSIRASGNTIPASASSKTILTQANSQLKTTRSGQVIENLDLHVDTGNAIHVSHDNVTIRNVRVRHKEGIGIFVSGAKNVIIENSEIINADPPKGIEPETSETINNIETLDAPSLMVRNVTLRDGSSGIYMVNSPNATITHVDGYNFHGPFPRGQFVQFSRSPDSTLTDFYVYNDKRNSHPEDNVSVYESPNVQIANGVIDGNNSVTGVGVMFEHESTGGRVRNVDAIRMGNGAFSSYNDDVTFERTRTFDSINGDQGRGKPASNGLQWNHSGVGVRILASTYTRLGNPDNISWGSHLPAAENIKEDSKAKPMTPITNAHSWIDSD
jgi:Right handed beta helix region